MAATPVAARAEEPSAVTINWQAAAVSDYRFRGLSLISPPQRGNLERTNRYLWIRSDWKPLPPPVTFTAGCGWEDGGFAQNKIDWTAGGSVRVGQLDIGLSYIGFKDRAGGGHGVVASATFSLK